MITPNTIIVTSDPTTWSKALWAVRLHVAKLPLDSGAGDVVAMLDDMRAWSESLTGRVE